MPSIPPMSHRYAPQAAVDLIKQFQPLFLQPFLSPGKVWTIGYAHTRTVRAGMVITADQACQMLDDDLRLVERAVDRLVTQSLMDSQFGALVSYTFDVSVSVFEKSGLLALLNRGWYDQVPVQLIRSAKVNKSSLARREAEGSLWSLAASQERRAA